MKKVNGVLSRRYVWNAKNQLVAELNGNGKVSDRYIYGTRSHVPDYMVSAGKTYRIVSDHLGSVRYVIDVNDGSIIQEIEYDELGQVTKNTKPGFQVFAFAGGLYDPDTRLVRFGLRDYDAEVGRWTAKDPIGFGGAQSNLYGYVMNDPVNLIDPTGLLFEEVIGRYLTPSQQITFGAGLAGFGVGVAGLFAWLGQPLGVLGGLAMAYEGSLNSDYGAKRATMMDPFEAENPRSDGSNYCRK